MKLLVVGCNGLLGQNLLRAGSAGNEFEMAGLALEAEPILPGYLSSYHRADLGDRHSLRRAIDACRPDWILNVAALTDVDACERNPELCDRINRDAVGWMAETKIPLVQISTDYVFDGKSGPYSESDAPRPLSRYGRAKLESEALALSGSPQSLVVRTLLLWGLGQGAKKSFTQFVLENLSAGKTVRAVTDQIGNPTLADDLALAILALLRKRCTGLYHAAGADLLSRFDWAEAVAHFYGLEASLIQKAVTADLHQDAVRPLDSGLRCDKLIAATAFRPRGLQEQLQWFRETQAQTGN